MSNFAMTHNIDAFIGAAPALDSSSATAGAGSNGTLVTGLAIDRAAFSYPLSASFGVRYKAALQAGATISFSASVETAADSAFATGTTVLATIANAVIDTGGTGGTTQRGVFRVPCDFAGALEFVRVKVTPTLSAANTDTVEYSAVAILGGQDYLPA